ncbi:acyltransferase family protein [Frateuria hangzhouensis]|uniref:acyltransferase family protein n=1 Tax=Frateuria hangzhouensis TaxID=2995589 RepID=UPI00226089CE|nr:acyltransferase [Frateuria sp. STR12]MCX7512533.1 acyltransferase [Frateuria sp. STR12]
MHRVPGLDLLRAWAIAWVMLFHSYVVGGLGERFAWLGNDGWIGVDLFFVLSGYLIGFQLLAPLARGEALAWRAFYLRRAFRILPAFLVVLAVYAAWPALREAPGLAPAWQFLSFTLNLLIDYEHDKAFSHAWSLCVEEHFYLVFPWLGWWLMRRPSPAKALAVGLGVVGFGMAVRGYVWLHDMAPVIGQPGPAFGLRFVEGIYYPTWARLDGLLAGVALAALRVGRPGAWMRLQRHAGLVLTAGLGLFVLALWMFRERLGLWPSVFGYPLLSLALALCVGAVTAMHTHWRLPGVGWMARVSYSLYLSHKLALHAVATWWVGPWQLHGLAAFGLYAVGVLAAGAALYYAVERPFLRWRERLDGRRPDVVALDIPAST